MQIKTDHGQGMVQLSSIKNERIKYVAKLMKDAKLRKEARAFVVEGVRLFSEVPVEDVLDVFCTENIVAEFGGSGAAEDAEKGEAGKAVGCGKAAGNVVPGEDADHVSREANIRRSLQILSSRNKVTVVTEEVYRKLSDTENPQGITAVVRAKEYSLDDVLGISGAEDSPEEPKKNSFVLIIDRLQDPGNLGTIIRTAEGAGVTGIVLSRDSVDRYNTKVVRGTMGSILRMPVYVSDDLVRDIGAMKERGVMIFGTHLDGTDMFEEDYRGNIAFLIGNEGKGLGPEVSGTADRLIRIPMEGRVESLNAGVSASIVCYEAMRQRRSRV